MEDADKTKQDLDISQLALDVCTFEVRYPTAYLLWDKHGAIWTEASKKWPDLQAQDAQPQASVFKLDKFQLSVQLDRAFVASSRPQSSLEDSKDIMAKFIEIVTQELKIASYNRVALRTVYFKEFARYEDAMNALMSTGMIRIPGERFFGIEKGKPLQAHYVLTWEGEATAATVRIQVLGRKLNVNIPPQLAHIEQLKSLDKETPRFVFDVDYYTKKPVAIGQLSSSEWISQTLHLINRDSKLFLRSHS
ncbi:MAG: hypothetical protein L0229_32215 [Blastocatellia bacterium]|nr:hypothetical protein [Blastocatellia bacterium]